MSSKLLKLLLVPLVCLAVTSCMVLRTPDVDRLQQGGYQTVDTYLSRYIEREMKRSKFVGLSIALVHDQEIVWSKGYGFSDRALADPVTVETQFRAGSVSKLFTSTAVMQLAEAGKIDLYAPLKQSIPSFSINSRFGSTEKITLHNTLTHRSGLPGTIADGMWSNQPDGFRTVASRLGKYFTTSEPGIVFSYSNAGYSLAGIAVENASGVPFAEYMRRNILDPLEMFNSNFNLDVSGSNVSRSYFDNKLVEELGLRDLPAGGLITDVIELSGLVKMIHARGRIGSKTLLQSSTVDTMLAPQQFDSRYDIRQGNGIGWFQFSDGLNDSYRAVGHGGQTLAHSAFLMTIPEIKMGVVVLANSPNLTGSLEGIAREAIKVVYPVALGRSVPDRRPLESPLLPGVESSFSGRYASAVGYMEITGGGSSYAVQAGDTKMQLQRQEDGAYRLVYKLLGLISLTPPEFKGMRFWARDLGGEKIIVAGRDQQMNLVATELNTDTSSPAWHQRLGEYKITNPMDSDIPIVKIEGFSLGFQDSFFYLLVRRGDTEVKLPLSIIDDQHAVLQGLGGGLGETIQVDENGLLDFSGLYLKRANI